MIYILSIIWLTWVDALSKYLAVEYLSHEVFLIPWVLSLEYVQNTGIAFSIPITWIILKVVTLVLIFGIFWYYWKEEKSKKSFLLNLSYTLIFAGAIWNAWERIFRWYVTDFIAVEHFAIFNLADSYITLGACGVLYYYFKNK